MTQENVKKTERITHMEKIEASRVQIGYVLRKVLRRPLREGGLEVWELRNSWPSFFIGCSEDSVGGKRWGPMSVRCSRLWNETDKGEQYREGETRGVTE